MKGIVATDYAGVIGIEGRLPWHYPEDLKFFKTMTTGSSIVMGRATYESIGKPLPKRENFVLSKTLDLSTPGIRVFRNPFAVTKVLKKEGKYDSAWVIGGAAVYREFWDDIQQWFITAIPHFHDGDAFFPLERLVRDFKHVHEVNISDTLISHQFNRSRFSPED